FPIIVKAAAGGGGKGMRIVTSADQLAGAIEAAQGEAARSFGDDSVYAERFVPSARHIEVQVFGDKFGDVVHLFERECSIQRRHQKIVEESPSPGIDEEQRAHLCSAAAGLARHLGYQGAGTVEFVVGDDGFYFIEMNTRLQVEHPVTEELTGVDLVEWQLRVAAGERLPITQDEIGVDGHAIEVRLYAEDPAAGWAPGAGTVHRYRHGHGARYEDAIGSGTEITTFYDPMIAKVISHGPTRREAARSLARELQSIELHGPATNRDMLVATLRSHTFLAGDTTTSFVDDHPDLLNAGPPNEVTTAHLAAALWARVAANRTADTLWGFATAGWRNVPSQWSSVGFDGKEIAYHVTNDGGLEFRSDGEGPVSATLTGSDPLAVEIDGVARHCWVNRVGSEFWVNSSEGQTCFVESPRFVVHDNVLAGGGPTAPMPGTVIAVLVSVGDHVDEHTDLLVMEAMKMEHRIRPPGPAVVAAVLVEPGDQVDAGQLLVRLEEEEG
ncbi:MAG: ATP-grasp domain-containing protein, partial [bacterium]|nr:ATP-grasp domain-containing protein [bacterium]